MKERRKGKRRRRLNGEGYIGQRPDGFWVAQVSLPGGRRKSVYAKTADGVRRKLKAELDAVASGRIVTRDKLTLADFLERFLEERRGRSARPQTMQHYENAVRRHIVPELGHILVRKLSAPDVQAFLEKKRAEVIGKNADGTPKTMSATMVRHLRTVLFMAMRLAVQWDLAGRNVVDGVRGPRASAPKIDPLSAEETIKFLATAATHPLGALWLVVGTLGLRRGEVLGLRWSDVDLDKAVLSVRVQLVHLKDSDGVPQPHLVEPKSKSAVRDLRMLPDVVEALRRRKAEQDAQRAELAEVWGPDLGLIFTTQHGTPLMGGAVSSTHTALCKKAGVRHVRFHDLRHGVATLMLGAGVDLRTISETLGHARPTITLTFYAHTKRPMMDAAVATLGAVLGRPS